MCRKSIELMLRAGCTTLVLCGQGDMVPIAQALHRRVRESGRPFVVVDLRCGEQRASVRSPASRGVEFAYTDLFARDAAGRTLAASLTLQGERLALHVDDTGAVYPLQIDPLIGTQQAKLLASDGATNNFFGDSVAISGDTALVGQSGDLLGASFVGAGAAYVFVRSGTTWTQQAKLVTSTHATGDSCGRSVALDGDTAVVGCFLQTGTFNNQGVVYVFVRSDRQSSRPHHDGQRLPYGRIVVRAFRRSLRARVAVSRADRAAHGGDRPRRDRAQSRHRVASARA